MAQVIQAVKDVFTALFGLSPALLARRIDRLRGKKRIHRADWVTATHRGRPAGLIEKFRELARSRGTAAPAAASCRGRVYLARFVDFHGGPFIASGGCLADRRRSFTCAPDRRSHCTYVIFTARRAAEQARSRSAKLAGRR